MSHTYLNKEINKANHDWWFDTKPQQGKMLKHVKEKQTKTEEKGKVHTGVDLGLASWRKREKPNKQCSMQNHKFPNLSIQTAEE